MEDLLIIKPKNEAFTYTATSEARIVEKVEYPEEGGILTYFYNHPYPEKQLVFPEVFYALGPAKRLFIDTIRVLKESSTAKFLFLLTLIIPGRKLFYKRLFKHAANIIWEGLERIAFKDEYYCRCCREINRVGKLLFGELKYRNSNTVFLASLCIFLEFDNAYRYRFQDAVKIFNKDNFNKNPYKEVKRFINEYTQRELLLKEKIDLFGSILPMLVLIPKIRKLFTKIINEINLEELYLDDGDRYWCYHRSDYNVDGLDIEIRLKLRQLLWTSSQNIKKA